jgi:hypothetical protein
MKRIEIKAAGDMPGDDRVVELDIRKIPGRQRAWTEEVLVTDLRDLMDSVPDGHVMAETVQQFDKYTGQRK